MEILSPPSLTSLKTYSEAQPHRLFRLRPLEEETLFIYNLKSAKDKSQMDQQSEQSSSRGLPSDEDSCSQSSPTVPSIKIEPPCDISDTASVNSTLSPRSVNSSSPYPRGQPLNFKKNLTARFLQQGSEDGSCYRSASLDIQPDEKRSRSLDRGLDDDDESAPQPLDLSAPQSSLRSKFEERARKMHRRNKTDSFESLANNEQNKLSTSHLLDMKRLSQSDVQLNVNKNKLGSLSSTSFTSSYETNDDTNELDITAQTNQKRPFMPLPPFSMMYNRGASTSSTDGSMEVAENQALSRFPGFPPGFPIVPFFGPQRAEMSTNPFLAAFPAMNPQMNAFIQHQVQNQNQSMVNQCNICKQTFPSFDSAGMAKHVAKHLPTEVTKTDSNNRVHMCKVCDRSFSRSDMLTRHMRLHTGLKPYECKVCGQVFSRSDHLNTHKRTHTGEKPYLCPKCPYAACRRDMITRHMRIHNDKDSKKRKRLGTLYPKDSISGSSVESSDSVPSRGGSMSGNSFDSSFEASDLRRHRQLLNPVDLLRGHAGRTSWSAPTSLDMADGHRPHASRWSAPQSTESVESNEPPYSESLEFSPNQCQSSPIKPRSLSGSKRPSLVRQDASLDEESSQHHTTPAFGLSASQSSGTPSFHGSRQSYRNPNEMLSLGNSMEYEDLTVAPGFSKERLLGSPSPNETPSPCSSSVASPKPLTLSTPSLPKQASLSEELNLQKCMLNE